MREAHLTYLRCPVCAGPLAVVETRDASGGRIIEGALGCANCAARYPILRGVPRFVPRENYASGFGLEWTEHARTQYDSATGLPLSEQRFFGQTGWPRRLEGQVVLEAGSGSGRFTEQAANTGAMVVSLDYSYAVDANHASNGHRDNVLIVQGDIYRMPFPRDCFDRAFCFGVLQHTPAPRRAFHSLVRHIRPGGRIAIDVYIKSIGRYLLGTKYWVRPVTRRVPPERLYPLVRRYVDLMWPVAGQIRRIPRIGPALNWRLLVADYSGHGLHGHLLKEWAYLDTFDMLAPRYDNPRTFADVRRWFREAELVEVEVQRGENGIQARGVRPAPVM